VSDALELGLRALAPGDLERHLGGTSVAVPRQLQRDQLHQAHRVGVGVYLLVVWAEGTAAMCARFP
jgi:hypothetical protein